MRHTQNAHIHGVAKVVFLIWIYVAQNHQTQRRPHSFHELAEFIFIFSASATKVMNVTPPQERDPL